MTWRTVKTKYGKAMQLTYRRRRWGGRGGDMGSTVEHHGMKIHYKEKTSNISRRKNGRMHKFVRGRLQFVKQLLVQFLKVPSLSYIQT